MRGKRPLQHKLSMGDLDGDTYSCIWDTRLVSHFQNCTEESDPSGESKKYMKSEKQEASTAIENYLLKDNLGYLCNMHMALCDRRGVKGPLDPEMIELSKLIQRSIDFSKHGNAVEL